MLDISTVGYANDSVFEKAKALAAQLNFIVDQKSELCLFVDEDRISLKMPGFSPICDDFSAELCHKRKSEGKKQGLVRACKPAMGLKIIDATAGWGRDSAVLASFGAEIIMIERHPLLISLLTDALLRRTDLDKQGFSLMLQGGDAYSYLASLKESDYPDVIYLDPMHPARSKSALVKKEMQALQQIIGPDEDALQLIELAITRVKQRVVVKWPQKIKPLLTAHAVVPGKTVRFDIYKKSE